MLLGSEVLEVAIGLSFMFLLLSIVCSTLTEWISWGLGLRAKTLERGLTQLVVGSKSTTASAPELEANAVFLANVLGHPLIEAIKGKSTMPSYIPARTFAGALLATVAQGDATLITVRAALAPPADGASAAIPEHLRRQLAAILDQADGSLVSFRKGVETWYDDAMERVGGWYKRNAQRWTIVIAVVVTLLLNANTLAVATGLLNDPTARAVFVAEAAKEVASPAPAASPAPSGVPQLKLSDIHDNLEPIAFGLGWSGIDLDPRKVDLAKVDLGLAAARMIGWLITILAISMGAPFWFDAVSRLVNLRAAGKPPERADASAS